MGVRGLVREADVSRTNVPDASASLKLKPKFSEFETQADPELPWSGKLLTRDVT